jgi:iron complex transport system substrate-binding protein
MLGDVFGVQERAAEIIAEMTGSINAIAEIGSTITDKKSVFFEIGALPYLYSFGTGTFLNELIELVGATNAMAGNEGWMSVTEEAAIDANPDVILTNVNYIEDPIGEILSRAGWDSVTAIANGDVHSIDTDSSSQANQYVVKALYEIAFAVYPEAFAPLAE